MTQRKEKTGICKSVVIAIVVAIRDVVKNGFHCNSSDMVELSNSTDMVELSNSSDMVELSNSTDMVELSNSSDMAFNHWN